MKFCLFFFSTRSKSRKNHSRIFILLLESASKCITQNHDVTNGKVLDENECRQMNEGMWQTVEYLTSKFQKPLVQSDSNTYDSLSFLEDEPPGKVI